MKIVQEDFWKIAKICGPEGTFLDLDGIEISIGHMKRSFISIRFIYPLNGAVSCQANALTTVLARESGQANALTGCELLSNTNNKPLASRGLASLSILKRVTIFDLSSLLGSDRNLYDEYLILNRFNKL
eukprot:sb/3475279/